MITNKRSIFLLMVISVVIFIFVYYNQLINQLIGSKKYQYVDLSPVTFDLEKIRLYLENDNKNGNNNIFKRYFFFSNKSNQIGPYRYIPDTRHSNCQKKYYNLSKKRVSIVITFHNEYRSILLRTLISILQRTPENFLQEIIVIDDYSKNEMDGKELKFLSMVKIIRNKKREGLIRSKNKGAKLATGDYLVFLDSNCEVNVGWLEPLIAKLLNNPGIAVSPVIDSIDVENFMYKKSSDILRGGFDWNLNFRWIPISKEEQESRKDFSESFISPTFSGGIFAISKKWFFKLKGFNSLLDNWGGESLDLSLKIWLCGGQIEIVPCSRVGHIFNNDLTFKFSKGNNVTYSRNLKVVAELWLDEYKHIFYYLNPDTINIQTNGSINELRILKKELQCRTFSWYLQNIFNELLREEKFGLPNEYLIAFGKLKCGNKCLNVKILNKHNQRISFENCNDGRITQWILYSLSSNENILSTEKYDICLSVVDNKSNVVTLEQNCKNNGISKWITQNGNLINKETRLCLECVFNNKVILSQCKRGNPLQLFNFSVQFQK